MKVQDVRCEVYLREQPQPPKEMTGSKWPALSGKIPFTILRIITDDGIEGCVISGLAINELAVSQIKQEIIGRDPFDREWIWHRLWRLRDPGWGHMPITTIVLSAVDIALWDIAGKALGMPIYKLMGAYRDKIRIYASSFGLPTPEDYVEEVISCKQRGITAYKLHVRQEIAVEACRAVREAVGDDMILMLDPGGRYTREHALRVGRELEKLNFYWYEEPIPDYDIEGLIMLREKLNIPICATEKVPQWNMFIISEYLVRRAVDMVRCDTLMSGGITPVKKIADMCDAFGVQCELHHGLVPTGDVANLHVQCAIKNCAFYEMRWPDFRRFALKEYPELDDEGYLHIPQKPGLGVEIDWESLGKPVKSY